MPDIENNPVFSHPLDYGIKIWRYMDFAQFVAMLEKNGLLFIRADLLGDPFEGSFPAANRSQFDSVHRRELELFVGQDPQKRDEFVKSVDKLHQSVKELRHKILISCWHMNEHESAAMWKIYAAGGKSVCIQSTYCKLRDCLPDEAEMGVVNYIDYEKVPIPEGNVLATFVHKWKWFEYEREVRALRWLPSEEAPPDYGQWQSVGLQDLVERVVVAPQADSWFTELVESVVKRYGFSFPVVPSDLSRPPLW